MDSEDITKESLVTKEEIEETLTRGWEAEDKFMLLTVIVKYGENFPKNEEEKCG